MKAFRVIMTPPDPVPIFTVRADYLKIQDGHLLFRNFAKSGSEYPELVYAVAPGHWRSVEEPER